MIVALAGLPGTGKNTLATELLHRLAGHALLLDKDRVRHALFGPQHTLYTRAYQVTQVRRFATRTRQPLRLIECVCAEAIIEQRLDADIARGAHPATNRDIELYRQLQASAQPIPDPKPRLDTTAPPPECAERALSYPHHPLPTDPDPLNAAPRAPHSEATALSRDLTVIARQAHAALVDGAGTPHTTSSRFTLAAAPAPRDPLLTTVHATITTDPSPLRSSGTAPGRQTPHGAPC